MRWGHEKLDSESWHVFPCCFATLSVLFSIQYGNRAVDKAKFGQHSATAGASLTFPEALALCTGSKPPFSSCCCCGLEASAAAGTTKHAGPLPASGVEHGDVPADRDLDSLAAASAAFFFLFAEGSLSKLGESRAPRALQSWGANRGCGGVLTIATSCTTLCDSAMPVSLCMYTVGRAVSLLRSECRVCGAEATRIPACLRRLAEGAWAGREGCSRMLGAELAWPWPLHAPSGLGSLRLQASPVPGSFPQQMTAWRQRSPREGWKSVR